MTEVQKTQNLQLTYGCYKQEADAEGALHAIRRPLVSKMIGCSLRSACLS